MASSTGPRHAAAPRTNGGALAAFLAAGVGAFAMGVVVLLNEARIFVPPPLYPSAGGVSSRAALATVAWLVAWGALHSRWKAREMRPGRVCAATLVLIAFGVLASIPVWPLR